MTTFLREMGKRPRAFAVTLWLWMSISAAMPVAAQSLSAGTVLPPTEIQLTMKPRGAAVADANGDGRADVIFFVIQDTAVAVEDDYLAFLYEQQTDGTMRLSMRFSMLPGGQSRYSMPFGAAFGDLDGDGRAEIVIPDADFDHLVILARGAGRYDEVKRLPLPFDFSLNQISIEDIDGDGNADILFKHMTNGYAFYRGSGHLDFAPPMAVMGHASGGFLLADADGDGLLDLLAASNDVEPNWKGFAINFGLPKQPGGNRPGGAGPFLLPTFSGIQDALAIGIGEFTGDHKPEIVLLNRIEHEPDQNNTMAMMQTISVYRMENRREFTLLKRDEYLDAGAVVPAQMRVADLNGDGRDEVYVFRGTQLEVIRQEGDGFAPVLILPAPSGGGGLSPPLASTHFADFNGDGCRDVGYLGNGYVIHYRTDCPTAASAAPRRATPMPATRSPQIKHRRGGRFRR